MLLSPCPAEGMLQACARTSDACLVQSYCCRHPCRRTQTRVLSATETQRRCPGPAALRQPSALRSMSSTAAASMNTVRSHHLPPASLLSPITHPLTTLTLSNAPAGDRTQLWIGSCLDLASPSRGRTLAAFTCSLSADAPYLLAGHTFDNNFITHWVDLGNPRICPGFHALSKNVGQRKHAMFAAFN
jgi:hypothetical protein